MSKGKEFILVPEIFNEFPVFMREWEEEKAVLYPVEVPPP
jgi:hypothetical protein